MMASARTVAFAGMEARPVRVEVSIAPGLPSFSVVGLPDKSVAESRERVRAALSASGLAMPARRVVVNLAPADMPKEGSHYDLPIALALMRAMEALGDGALEGWLMVGELGLDGALASTPGALPAAMRAAQEGWSFMCPKANGSEAAWSGVGRAGSAGGLAAPSRLLEAANHLAGRQTLAVPEPEPAQAIVSDCDMAQVVGQPLARRALEIAAAGGHNLLLIGPPGAGKSMLAERLATIMPPLAPREALETRMIASLAGLGAGEGGIMTRTRPFRAPHHSASMAAMVGGGRRARPGEASLAHEGVLFLDEAAEFARPALEALREPMERGAITIARAQAHITYPARALVVAAMNPCPCGYADDPARACSRAPKCARAYAAKLSGPFLDRMDLRVHVAPTPIEALGKGRPGEASAAIVARVIAARARQTARAQALEVPAWMGVNARLPGEKLLEGDMDTGAREMLEAAATRFGFSPRGFFRTLRVARTIADLDGVNAIARAHIGEALGYREGN